MVSAGWVGEHASMPSNAAPDRVVSLGYSLEACPACGSESAPFPLRMLGTRLWCRCGYMVLAASFGFPLHVADEDAPWTS